MTRIPDLDLNTYPALDDLLVTHDVSDTTDGADGTSKRATLGSIIGGKSFDTVAAMVASTGLIVGDTVVTLGYYLAGDGGHGLYRVVAAATGSDDGGIYHDLSGITGQAELVYNNLVNVAQFGMSTSRTGAQNYDAFENALGADVPLDFTEIYTVYPTDNILLDDDRDLYLVSSNRAGGISFETRTIPNSSYFLTQGLISVHIMGTILVDGLQVSSPDGDVNSLISGPLYVVLPEGGTQYIQDMVVRNCTWTGRIQVCYFRGEATTDPSVNWFGIRRFVFENNECRDIYAQLIGLRHIPHDCITMRNNRFHNMSCEILFSGISNGAANQDEIYQEKRLIVIEGNEWTTDDDFWSVENVSTYLTYVVYEGREIKTTDNVMSGVKTVQTQLNVYLTYSSALHVTESNNIYQNSGNLARATARNTLMKSKSIPEPVGSDAVGTRTYQNNQYIIEEEWLTRISKVVADCCHTLTELPSGLFPTVDTITDNVFRLMSVEGMGANDASHQSYSVRCERNQINAKYWNTYIIANPNHAMFSFNQGIATDPTVFSVCDNSIMVENTLDVIGAGFLEGGFHTGCFIIKSNYVNVPSTTSYGMDWLSKTGSHKPDVIMENNIFDVDNQAVGLFSVRQNMRKAIVNESSIQTLVSQAAKVLNFPCVGKGSNVKFQVYGDYELKLYLPILYQDDDLNSLYDLYSGTHTVLGTIYREDSTGWQQVTFTYDFVYDVGDSEYHVMFNDTTPTARDYLVSGGVGLNTAMELLTDTGTSSSLITSITLKNDGGNNRHWRVVPDNPYSNGLLRLELMVI